MFASNNTIGLDFYIPVKDGEKYIKDCVESVLAQTVQPKSITVYYNVTSTDRTREILKNYPTVRVVDVTFPLSDARNFAIDDLSSDWIGCCDADVVLSPDWIERLCEKSSNGAVILSGNTQERILTVGDLYRSITSPHNWGRHDVKNPYMLVPDMIADRKKLKSIGGYKTGWVNYEDSDIAKRLREAGEFFYYVAGAKATHHRQDDFTSCLELRWRHSFRRQEGLFESEDSLAQKMLNNVALATVILSKARELGNKELMRVVHLMPLQHFLADVEFFCKSKALRKAKTKLDLNAVLDVALALVGEKAQSYINVMRELVDLELAQHFLKNYGQFLRLSLELLNEHGGVLERLSGISDLKNQDCWGVDDNDWQAMRERTLKQLTLKNLKIESEFSLDESVPKLINVASCGLASFRQKVFPVQGRVLTCRDITEFLSGFNYQIHWTETFQGSSMIAFGPC